MLGAMAIAAWGYQLFSAGWLALPGALFIALVVAHERVIAGRRRCRAFAGHWQRGLDRMAGQWAGRGVTRTDFCDEDHPYARDLDVFGHGSLFDLMCTARTRAGEETLARWLISPASPEVVQARHGAVTDLKDRLDLREALALQGDVLRRSLHPEALTSWANAAPPWTARTQRRLQGLALALAAAAVLSLAFWALGASGPLPFMILLVIEGVLVRFAHRRIASIASAVEQPAEELRTLSGVIALVERESFSAAMTRELKTGLGWGPQGAGRRLRRLQLLTSARDAARNQLFAPVAFVLLWNLQLTLAIESWRRLHGPSVSRWLNAVGELEALVSLATYAHEHPADVFPRMSAGPARFEAVAIGHPLLVETQCVRNDLHLNEATRLVVVSGSNMSGKSTLLRTVGLGAIMAQAGAPVRARQLTLTPLAVGATLSIHDSIQHGRSRFYAEIERLKLLVEMAMGERPLLFLFDELFHGTNSHDRLQGAKVLLKSFLAYGAVGLVTTHDLAITGLTHEVPVSTNVHFADDIVGDRLVFDYTLKAGVVTRSNALALMRVVGLPV